jgi:hypothetical protein
LTSKTSGLFSIGSDLIADQFNILAGNVGIGTTNPDSRVQITGGGLCVGSDANCNTDNNTEGTVYSGATAMTVYDVAENYPTKDLTLEPTEIVALDQDMGVFVKRAVSSDIALGVISAEPAVLLGGFNGAQFKEEHQVAVALSGRVPVKVSTESGPIKIGDRITSSSLAGVGMKAITSGVTVGIALESFDGTTATTTETIKVSPPEGGETLTTVQTGKILVFVNLGYSKLDSELLKSDFKRLVRRPAVRKSERQLLRNSQSQRQRHYQRLENPRHGREVED